MTDRRPLLVVDGPRRAAEARVATTIDEASADGWLIVRGWAAPLARDRVVCTGVIQDADGARRALLAAVAGAGLIVTFSADPETLDRLLDDLRRVGPVERVTATAAAGELLTPGQRFLLGLLAEGLDLSAAAAKLGITRRTAVRRLAAGRRTLGVESTEAAIAAAFAWSDHSTGR